MLDNRKMLPTQADSSSTSNGEVSQSALQREQELRAQAIGWEAPTHSDIPIAEESEIPVLDLGSYFTALRAADTEAVTRERVRLGAQLRDVGEKIGFHYVVNHGLAEEVLEKTFSATKSFHSLPQDVKKKYEMDREGRAGVGYLAVNNFKLPARDKGNMNEAFVVKRELGPRNISLEDMPWPGSEPGYGFEGSDFRATVLTCCNEMEQLSLAMLPIYAEALRLPPDYFAAAFKSPLFRFRMSHYPCTPGGEFGINPHVDTSFFTILASTGDPNTFSVYWLTPTLADATGLVVHSAASQRWVRAREVPNSLIINTGQLLAEISNDTWLATKHYAINSQAHDRYSLPFFFNATADHVMECVPSCVDEQHPPKYSPKSYLQSQGVVQGE